MPFQSLFLREALLTLHRPLGLCGTCAETTCLSPGLFYHLDKYSRCLQPSCGHPQGQKICCARTQTHSRVSLLPSSSLQKETCELLPGLPVSADESNVHKSSTLNPSCCSASLPRRLALFLCWVPHPPWLSQPQRASSIFSAFSSHCFCFLICPDFTSPPIPG